MEFCPSSRLFTFPGDFTSAILNIDKMDLFALMSSVKQIIIRIQSTLKNNVKKIMLSVSSHFERSVMCFVI